jgi:seryl-tRNA synthetase
MKCESAPGVNRRYVHLLNNTAVATSRVMVAIFENFQQDGTVLLPRVLHKYTGFKQIPAKKRKA